MPLKLTPAHSNPMKMIIKLVVYLVIVIAVILAGLILFGTLTMYRPAGRTLLMESPSPSQLSQSNPINLLTWNIGYGGLGDDMDFFYDGGSKTRSSRQRTLENQKAILEFLEDFSNSDFIFLQEVDQRARRSFYTDMTRSLQELFPSNTQTYAQNYMVRFVPVPFTAPMGYVDSGILTSSPWLAASSERISFPGNYPWPGRLFNLRRAMLVNRYQVDNGRQLVVINTHNSAFDDGSLRKLQMEFMKDFMIREYEMGNYVIAGGDWNQCPPGFEPRFEYNLFDTLELMYIPEDFLPGWQWVYDPTVPTNRRVIAPYDRSSTLTTLIDFFLISPNMQLEEVRGVHLDFKHSDHNPVIAKVRFADRPSGN